MDFCSTVQGSMLEGFYPKGWDMQKIDACCDHAPEEITERQDFWNKDFTPISCKNVAEFDVKMGHEIANEIRKANDCGMISSIFAVSIKNFIAIISLIIFYQSLAQ